MDHGGGDLRVLSALLGLKRQAPDRVHLLLGNRDINKMRLACELAPGAMALDPSAVRAPDFLSGIVSTQYQDFLRGITRFKPGAHDPLSFVPAAWRDEATAMAQADTRVNRLKWLLRFTMGAPRAFEGRRAELRAFGLASNDDAVAESFVSSVMPGGASMEYLRQAQVAALLGDTLFVHGALPSAPCIATFVSPQSSLCELSVVDWCRRVNTWATQEIKSWQDDPLDYFQAGGELVRYAAPGCAHSVVYADWLNAAPPRRPANPFQIDETVSRFLRRGGVKRIVCGHQPYGDAPLVLRADEEDACTVIVADTMYSDPSAKDLRGVAVSEVCIDADVVGEGGRGVRSQCAIRGILRNGMRHGCVVEEDRLLGQAFHQGVCVSRVEDTSEDTYVVLNREDHSLAVSSQLVSHAGLER